MFKKLILLIATLALAGCATTGSLPPSSQPADALPEPDMPISERTEGLEPDAYDGLKLTAELITEKPILPGDAFEVRVDLENTGDKTVAYVQGSGSWRTPQNLFGEGEHLQYVLPRDNLGIATMDFVVQFLEPGESKNFNLTFMAIEPSADFVERTHELFYESDIYIADMSWAELQETFPDLIATQPGVHGAGVFLLYSILDPDAADDVSVDISVPTTFAQALVPVTIDQEAA